MRPAKDLPYSDEFHSTEDYMAQLLAFISTSELFQLLCGGVHILDFYTSDPGHYYTTLPEEWQTYLLQIAAMDFLDFLMRDDLNVLSETLRNGPGMPPGSLLQYVRDVRRFSLCRDFSPQKARLAKLPRSVSLGMTEKKKHEVVHAAEFIDRLCDEVSTRTRGATRISHCLDLGSGQNYLGRTLASPPYDRHVIAVESKEHNFLGARELDVKSGMAARQKVLRNKKVFYPVLRALPRDKRGDPDAWRAKAREMGFADEEVDSLELGPGKLLPPTYATGEGKGFVHYVVGRLDTGDLGEVLAQVERDREALGMPTGALDIMSVSLHSCGNLSHHGIRSLVENPQVRAAAIVGCCYNLMTERLGPPTYKPPFARPNLQPLNGRVRRESERRDPQGFPMSRRFVEACGGRGVRFNITARMMACQAPRNWGPEDSDAFMRRHFFRAVLQRIFLDRGVITRVYHGGAGNDGNDEDDGDDTAYSTTPLILGSLPKRSYVSFVTYVRDAVAKLTREGAAANSTSDAPPEPSDPGLAARVAERMSGLTDVEVAEYERAFGPRRRELEAVWSLMAFSAGVVESAIVADRWMFLKEHCGDQGVVGDCWVETMFDHALSPRNLVVVGIK